MRILILCCLLALSGCASRRSEGQFAANYHGLTVAAAWHVEIDHR